MEASGFTHYKLHLLNSILSGMLTDQRKQLIALVSEYFCVDEEGATDLIEMCAEVWHTPRCV